ncbi:M20/M25/M40 family metallo-hydrolase [Psychrobacillus lasiicapitis]|uniref:M20/M25/M40 family metallo-hydrolase n=1 Tax=Psychrobacillus lasiicapitis TaxID=1636719 RepID=A0A544SWQ2_9BACI|nr:M20/M25/M40 family metallo-hydrolase [Psychrobacillus lasiicapitis]TQR09626.1 M20/M25/M40 family metallo-hydrolase [Psychrobacillus lasiicapitis]GGA28900.1 peptidase M20 [Psychrobacillus lasiicapitis]
MITTKNEILKLTEELVRVESIVETPGEIDAAKKIYEIISEMPYFIQKPDQVILSKTSDDQLERYNVLAFVEGTKEKRNKKSIILMGHLDTVGIDDYTNLKDVACNPEELMKKLHDEQLPELVKEQLDSGEWYFGRGVLDMKSGVASHMSLLKYFSEHPEELAGNLVFFSECDEEVSSKGVLSGLKELKKWKEERDFEYIGLINSDFVAPLYDGDENRYVYKGTVGKLLPSFFITGAETHVGSAFEGLDPNYIAAELTRQISYNPELCDRHLGETPAPPISLKQMDLKPNYTVQTALSAYVYFNLFVHSWSPQEVLTKLSEQAVIAFENALNTMNERYESFCRLSQQPFKQLPWKSRVILYEDMTKSLKEEHGEVFVAHINKFKANLLLDEKLDTRMFAARVVEEEWKWMKDQSPAIILLYSSLYSPCLDLTGKNEQEENLISALDKAIEKVQSQYKYPIVSKNYFPYICDMSCVALKDDEKSIQSVINNNPAWGTKHYVNYEDIREINVPAINIGPYGYDAHKRYERMEIEFSTEVIPTITKEIIKTLIG